MDRTVSIVIPTYDRVQLTDRAVHSVSSHRPDQVQIVVVDDCGNIAYHFRCDSNAHGISVQVHRSQFNGGPGVARRIALELSSGGAVGFLDSDDIYEPGWVDEGMMHVESARIRGKRGIFIAGQARHGSPLLRMLHDALSRLPQPIMTIGARVLAIFFNPFYTPAVMASRHLCSFKDSLRFCEDYYMNAMALFRADEVIVSRKYACSLARRPGRSGGESAEAAKMFRGEMQVRWMLMKSEHVPMLYKLLLPMGVVYQLVRTSLKLSFALIYKFSRLARR